jgi:hypothetical protein
MRGRSERFKVWLKVKKELEAANNNVLASRVSSSQRIFRRGQCYKTFSSVIYNFLNKPECFPLARLQPYP